MKVSVLMITYNHEKFIRQAVESVLMQETDFEYELVVGEDCSTDNTRNILIDLQRSNPGKIRLLLPTRNLGMHENFAQTLGACKGEYIALLEGDDFWMSPDKLQEQVDFLNAHSECAICFHKVRMFFEDTEQPDVEYPEDMKPISRLEDLLKTNFIPTLSVMFRSVACSQIPEWSRSLSLIDWPFQILNAQYGSIGYIDRVMAAYRVHEGGVWSTKDKVHKLNQFLSMYEHLNPQLGFKYNSIIRSAVAMCNYQLLLEYERRCDRANSRAFLRKCVADCWNSRSIPPRHLLKVFVKLYLTGALSKQHYSVR